MTLDIHPRELAVGHCVQTVLAKTNILISRDSDDNAAFTVIVRRSFSDYAMAFLIDAAETCGYELKV